MEGVTVPRILEMRNLSMVLQRLIIPNVLSWNSGQIHIRNFPAISFKNCCYKLSYNGAHWAILSTVPRVLKTNNLSTVQLVWEFHKE